MIGPLYNTVYKFYLVYTPALGLLASVSLVDSGSASLCSSSANPCLLYSTPWSPLRHQSSAGALAGGYRSGFSRPSGGDR
ncbi:hypothetical protein B0H16DRAFT_1597230 [Mycena metata]|uniref:Uncharacterized protein n=1 Tax=Mycena metata TaxID=1033252 RepID=A0AAD7HNV0_9AGAR|nr:hypothetical protein B0H16DRAFT_1605652 [Mycena metata]KAJ7724129.1 hypothetical protein B0H16DRAFT_1597230 [Mycena metata]